MSVVSRDPHLANSGIPCDLEQVKRIGALGVLTEEVIREIQQSLTVISNYANGCAHRLEKGKISTSELRSLVSEISTTAMRSNEVLRRAKRFCQKHPADVQLLDLNQLILNTVTMFQEETEQKLYTIELNLQRDLPAISADSLQISQVLINLLINGIDALTDWPGQRLLTVETLYTPHDNFVHCIVSDTGPGIPTALQSQVFSPFYSSKQGSLGLGLVLCRAIVDRLGGQLRLVSTEHAGSQFRFAIPATGQDSLGQG